MIGSMNAAPYRQARRALVVAAALVCGHAMGAVEGAAWFNQTVRPLLEKRCFECHSHAGKIKGGLALDSKSGWVQGGDHGTALVPGKVDDSLMIKAIRYEDPDLQMPPKTRLSAGEVAILERWVKEGAADPRENQATAARKKGVDIQEALKHWAFQPVKATGTQGELKTLLSHGLASQVEADRYTLLRRASFDLTGLPPTADEITQFLADRSPDAFAHVVDRLLGSGAFGERWARLWLDLVGYADQVGTANNVPAPFAWRYRDYVVRSFNADKPFDRFIHEQIAGDLMQAKTVAERRDQITATGFLLLGNINIVEADKAKLRVDMVDQQVEKVGKAFLGMTLNCVRCHDHKFDPVSLQDYYGLAGIFMSTESVYHTGRGVWSAPTFSELPATPEDDARLDLARTEHEREVAEVKAKIAEAKATSSDLQTRLAAMTDKAVRAPLEKQKAESDKLARDLGNRLLHLDYLQPTPAVANATRDSDHPADMRITIRGNAHALGDAVPRGFVKAAFTGAAPAIPSAQSGRLQLADWITHPNNKLTARVTVNRIWQKLFGQGIVPSVDYFGLRGEKPSNLPLLDALAARFVRLGWSQKQLIREIMLSPAYRQESVETAEPTRLAQHRFRLDAEAIRDAVLAVSGTLLSASGGPALALEYPENVNGLDPKSVNPVAFSVTKFRPEQPSVRTVYLPIIRSGLQKGSADILDVFDFPQPAQMQGQRSITTVPPQALYLMNGPLAKNEGGKLGDQLWKSPAASDAERLASLYLRVLNRPITAEENASAQAFLASFNEPVAASDEEPQRKHLAWAQLCQALFASNEFLFRL